MGWRNRNTNVETAPLASGPGTLHSSKSLVAAGEYVTADELNGRTSVATHNGTARWVSDLWGYYDAVGEFHYDANFLASCLSRCILRLGVLDKDNKVGPAFDEDGNPMEGVDAQLADLGVRMLAELRATMPGLTLAHPLGGQAALLYRMGSNLGAVAECYLIGTELEGKGRVWEVLSSVELQPMDTPKGEPQKFKRRRSRSTTFEEVTPHFYLRIYRSHPAFSDEPDTANKPLRGTLERMALLTAEGVADSKSRLSGPGIYWLPSEIDFPEDDDIENPDAGDEYITRELIATASVSIANPSAASRFVPIVARAPGELIDHIRHDRFGYDDNSLNEKRVAAVGDFARGTDLPYEATVGHGQTSFANAFSIDESLAKLHVQPWLDLINGFLTAGYLTPGLMKARGGDPTKELPPDDIAKFVVWGDISQLVSHANPEKVAAAAYGTETNPNFLISASGYRRLTGIPESERPSDEEIAMRMERAHTLRLRSEIGGPTEKNDDEVEPEEPIPDAPDVDEEIGKRVMSMGEYVVARAVDRAGSKLRSKVAGRKELAARLEGVDACDVGRVLGPSVVAGLGSADWLFGGEFATFERTVFQTCTEAGREDAIELTEAAVNMVAKAAASRLYNPTVRLDSHLAAEFLDLLIRS